MHIDDNKFKPSLAIKPDRGHVCHHLTPHKPFEENDPLIMVEGTGLRIRYAKGKEYLDSVSGALWTVNAGYARESVRIIDKAGDRAFV